MSAGRDRCAIGCISCTASATTCSRSRKEAGGLRVTGYVAALAEQGPTRGPQNVFINRRIVKDRTIAHAIIDSYSVGVDQGAQPGGAPVHRDAARRGRRQRAPDEGRSAVPRSVARARSRAARADGRARAGRRAAAAAAAGGRRTGRRRCGAFPACSAAATFPSRWHAGERATSADSAETRLKPDATSDAAGVASGFSRTSGDTRHPADDSARPVSRHVHHRRRRRGDRDHRSARGARARAVRARDGAADRGRARIAAAAGAAADRSRAVGAPGARRPRATSSSASGSRSKSFGGRDDQGRRPCRRC